MTQLGSRSAIVEIAGEIGNPARGEDERGFLAVQIGEFALKLDDGVAGAGNVARAAGAGADPAAVSTIAAITSGCWPMPR